MAVPLGILGGIYLSEYSAGSWFGNITRFFADVMTGVPSIVMGLFIYTIWVLEFGVSAFAGALALASLMLPVVIRTSEEMLRLVPRELRESAYALGGRKAGTIIRVVLPAAAPGHHQRCVAGDRPGRGRDRAARVRDAAVQRPPDEHRSVQRPNTALPAQIFNNAKQVFPGPQDRAWGAALTLIGIVFVFTILARVVATVFARKHTHDGVVGERPADPAY